MAQALWSREVQIALIEKVRNEPVLWDTTHPNYKKKLLKRHIYNQIARQLKEQFPSVDGITAGKEYSHKTYECQRKMKSLNIYRSGQV